MRDRILLAHRKRHTSFWLVLKVLTMNAGNHMMAVILHYFSKLRSCGLIMSKWLQLESFCLWKSCSAKELVFSNIWFMVIFSDITEKQCITVTYSPLKSENSSCTTLHSCALVYNNCYCMWCTFLMLNAGHEICCTSVHDVQPAAACGPYRLPQKFQIYHIWKC